PQPAATPIPTLAATAAPAPPSPTQAPVSTPGTTTTVTSPNIDVGLVLIVGLVVVALAATAWFFLTRPLTRAPSVTPVPPKPAEDDDLTLDIGAQSGTLDETLDGRARRRPQTQPGARLVITRNGVRSEVPMNDPEITLGRQGATVLIDDPLA